MLLKSKHESDKITISVDGELDHHTSAILKQYIDNEVFINKNVSEIILDFKNLNFMDSSGIGVLIGRYKELSKKNIILSVKDVKPQVYKVFEISGLFKIIKLRGA